MSEEKIYPSMVIRSQAEAIELLEKENQRLKEENERLKQPTIFIDTQDMEERYGEELYKEYLEKENTQLKEVIEEVRGYIKEHPCDTWYYIEKKSTKQYDYEVHRCDEEVLKILDKAKGEDNVC